MIKNSQTVVRKGDYYEVETIDDTLFSHKPSKKEEPIVTSNMLPSEHVLVDLPSFNTARSAYFYPPSANHFSDKGLDELRTELQNLLKMKNLKDEDKEQMQKMIAEIGEIKDGKIYGLNELRIKDQKAKQQTAKQNQKQIDIVVQLELKELMNKTKKLEQFDYPQLSKLQHQLQVLLGEKKTPSQVTAPLTDDKLKQEIESLYAQVSSLTCLQDLTGLLSRIASSTDKHSCMAAWVKELQALSDSNRDFLLEVKEDRRLVDLIEKQWEINVNNTKKILTQMREKLKKK